MVCVYHLFTNLEILHLSGKWLFSPDARYYCRIVFYGVISFNSHFKASPGFPAEFSLVLLARNYPRLPKTKASILLLENSFQRTKLDISGAGNLNIDFSDLKPSILSIMLYFLCKIQISYWCCRELCSYSVYPLMLYMTEKLKRN